MYCSILLEYKKKKKKKNSYVVQRIGLLRLLYQYVNSISHKTPPKLLYTLELWVKICVQIMKSYKSGDFSIGCKVIALLLSQV